ncbi:MAG TPA: hypothetical protein VNI01_13205 [Elusimicrobiota bacterium]|nr:hypothetical protein [Elusimicrobiota bacterium]
MNKKRILTAAALGITALVGFRLAVYQLDNNPVGKWLGELTLRRNVGLLRTGTPTERLLAASRLSDYPDRNEVRSALRVALEDPDPAVAAEARRNLRAAFQLAARP